MTEPTVVYQEGVVVVTEQVQTVTEITGTSTVTEIAAVAGVRGPAGADGEPGAPGADGADGAPGEDGADGAPGTTTWAGITDKPSTFPPEAHTQAASTITDFDTEVSNNTDVAANTAARHTHSNKALLDTYTQAEASLADAVTKKHAHANSAVLDATTASFLIADETKLDGIEALADVTDAANVSAAGALMTSAAPELIRDTMGTALVAGTGVTVTPSDGSDTITVASKGVSWSVALVGSNQVLSTMLCNPWSAVSTTLATFAYAANTLYLTPFVVPLNQTEINRLFITVTTASGSGSCRLGIFTSRLEAGIANIQSATSTAAVDLLHDVGVVSTSTNGAKAIGHWTNTDPSAIHKAVTPGSIILLGVLLDQAATLNTYTPTGGFAQNASRSPYGGVKVAATYGTFVSSYSALIPEFCATYFGVDP